MNSRALQAVKTKQKIYENSIRLFKKNGFDKVTIQDIAKASGVSVGSFYNYFGSKQDILYDRFVIADEIFSEFSSAGIKGNTYKDKISNYMLFYIDFVLTQPYDFTKVLYNNDSKMFLRKGRAMQTLLDPLIQSAVDSGEIGCEMSVDEINEFLFQAMRGLVFHWCLNDGGFDLRERAIRYLNLYVKAL